MTNLYKWHANPETLDHYHEAFDKIPELIWEKYSGNIEELKLREQYLAKDSKYYAKYLLSQLNKTQQIAFAILSAKEVCHEKKWNTWADRWLSGKDRSKRSAYD